MENPINITVSYDHKMGGYSFHPYYFEYIALIEEEVGLKMGLNFTLFAPIHEWQPWYYFTSDPPLVWKNSGSFVQIDIQSALCFLLMMILSGAMVYFSTRCLRRWLPSTKGFWTILWDFVSSFFYEPFPTDSKSLSIRFVLAFWLLGITIFCNEVNGVFKGKLSAKEYAGVETKEDLDALEYKFQYDDKYSKTYWSYKYGKTTKMELTSFTFIPRFEKFLYISKKSAAERSVTHLLWLGNIESRLFKYDRRVHETIMNWELRLYEGSTGNVRDQTEFQYRLKNQVNEDAQLFTAYEMADVSVPFQLYGYGLAAAIVVKFIEIILAIYNNQKPKRKPKYPKPFQ